jgi:hypothetical protein
MVLWIEKPHDSGLEYPAVCYVNLLKVKPSLPFAAKGSCNDSTPFQIIRHYCFDSLLLLCM